MFLNGCGYYTSKFKAPKFLSRATICDFASPRTRNILPVLTVGAEILTNSRQNSKFFKILLIVS
jgi:hypothetical protein